MKPSWGWGGLREYKAKWLPKEALQIDEKRRDAKAKEKTKNLLI